MKSEWRLTEAEDRQTRELMRDLHQPRPAFFYIDLAASALLGWAAFAFAVASRPWSAVMFAAILVSALALYRGLCFLHEISHIKRGSLPGFESVWNASIGFPLLMPSFVYVGVHQYHHKLSTYGTKQDPEYLPFAHNWGMTTAFALEGFLIPVFLMLRFLLLAPLGLAIPRLERWLVTHGSSLTMNLAFRRQSDEALVRRIRRQSLAILFLWGSTASLCASGLVPWRVFAIWFAICSLASFVNTMRTLGAHAYESTGEPLDRGGQLLDSIDTPGAFWTELWAPVGLRYHALHHYFPGIPYHNLPAAYGRLVGSLCSEAAYHRVKSSGLAYSLRELYRKGWKHPRIAVH